MKILNEIIPNIEYIIVCLSVVTIAVCTLINFLKKPSMEQIKSFQEWLLYCVIEAEKKFGSGTGKIKIRYVYDLFLNKFPNLSLYLTYEQFSEYIDIALDRMRELIESNLKIQQYISEN